MYRAEKNSLGYTTALETIAYAAVGQVARSLRMALSCYSDVSSLSVHLQVIIGSLRNDDGKANDLDNATNHYQMVG